VKQPSEKHFIDHIRFQKRILNLWEKKAQRELIALENADWRKWCSWQLKVESDANKTLADSKLKKELAEKLESTDQGNSKKSKTFKRNKVEIISSSNILQDLDSVLMTWSH
jgi:hypothetical protein